MRPQRRIKNDSTPKMVVNLPVEVVVREIPSIQIKSSSIEILSIEDKQSQKKIVVNTKELGQITLWESDSYDRIGQWTDSDVESRLIELFLK
jgi:hypothetical protein